MRQPTISFAPSHFCLAGVIGADSLWRPLLPKVLMAEGIVAALELQTKGESIFEEP
jgi:hypothetical protein